MGSQIAALAVEEGERPLISDINPQKEAIGKIVDLNKVDIIQGDVLDFAKFEDSISRTNVDRIVHTAANPLLTIGAQANPYDAIRLNILGTANALELGRKFQIKRFVFASSSVLYINRKGGLESGQLTEDNYPRPTTFYASTKLSCENIGLNYFDAFGLDFVALRFRAIFGPWIGSGGGGGPTNIIRQLIERSLEGQEYTLPSKLVELVYSKDAARAVMLALDLKKSFQNRIFNVGMGRSYLPSELGKLVSEKIRQANIHVDRSSEESPDKTVNIARSKVELGYVPKYDMSAALDDYISWYKHVRKMR